MTNELSQNYWVLAYYSFTPIVDPQAEVALHKAYFADKDASCRIYISEEGVNGQMCASQAHAQEYIEWMHSREQFRHMKFKIHPYHEHVFPKKTIKYRKQLVAIDSKVDLNTRGEHVSPKKWKEMLDSKEERILLDVRNDYEWKVGRFDGAELPPCETFREFVTYADELKDKVEAKNTPVMMYCTGGIRCELYSSILMERGFKSVYQLDGGIIGYGLEEGNEHWLGKLFVFDDRLTVPINPDTPTPVIGTCEICNTPIENYYNCANADCNKLFLCCHTCLESHAGCCSENCMNAPESRLRPYQMQHPHKPFRKMKKD